MQHRPTLLRATCCIVWTPCCAMLHDVAWSLTLFKLHATSSNIVQQGVQTMQHVARNNVGWCCMQHVAFVWTGLNGYNSSHFPAVCGSGRALLEAEAGGCFTGIQEMQGVLQTQGEYYTYMADKDFTSHWPQSLKLGTIVTHISSSEMMFE